MQGADEKFFEQNHSSLIQQMFRRGRRPIYHDDYSDEGSDDNMEATLDDILAEERKSRRIGVREDAEEERKLQEAEERKRQAKKKKQKSKK